MGLLNDIANAINSLTNLQKVQVENTKAQTQKNKIRRITKENKELKKDLSRNQRIGIVSILIGIVSIIITVFFVYFPIHNTP